MTASIEILQSEIESTKSKIKVVEKQIERHDLDLSQYNTRIGIISETNVKHEQMVLSMDKKVDEHYKSFLEEKVSKTKDIKEIWEFIKQRDNQMLMKITIAVSIINFAFQWVPKLVK